MNRINAAARDVHKLSRIFFGNVSASRKIKYAATVVKRHTRDAPTPTYVITDKDNKCCSLIPISAWPSLSVSSPAEDKSINTAKDVRWLHWHTVYLVSIYKSHFSRMLYATVFNQTRLEIFIRTWPQYTYVSVLAGNTTTHPASDHASRIPKLEPSSTSFSSNQRQLRLDSLYAWLCRCGTFNITYVPPKMSETKNADRFYKETFSRSEYVACVLHGTKFPSSNFPLDRAPETFADTTLPGIPWVPLAVRFFARNSLSLAYTTTSTGLKAFGEPSNMVRSGGKLTSTRERSRVCSCSVNVAFCSGIVL
eukprot:m.1532041 g.1532041  ORF g.1532041 m.1532041 type:complete len:308 (+) comp25240_c0_seq87:4319-5242(+)